MHLIELTDYAVSFSGSEADLKGYQFNLSRGDVCSIETRYPLKANLFIKALATLVTPESGSYRFDEEILDFSDYRKLLPFKKRIGYIAPDSYMISNRTIRENLLFRRYYFENSLSLDLDENTMNLCRLFHIDTKLHLRPGQLRPIDLRYAIAIRELTKSSDLLLLDRPEDVISVNRFKNFTEIIKKDIIPKQAVVFFSRDRYFIETLANRQIQIENGRVATRHMNPEA